MRSVLVSIRRRAGLLVAPALVAASATVLSTGATTSAAPGSSAAAGDRVHTWSVAVRRGGSDARITFHRSRAGQAFVDATVSARGVSWAEPGNESAVVSVFIDGRYATDIVITSAGPVRREFALGALGTGRHTLRLHYAAGRSLSRAGVAALKDVRFRTVAAGSPAVRRGSVRPGALRP